MPILHWLTRDDDLRAASRVPYRLLEETPELSVPDVEIHKNGGYPLPLRYDPQSLTMPIK